MKACGPLSFKNMFGGFGIYSGSQIFAMIIKDNLYFRVGPSNQAEYEAAGMVPFTYTGKDGKIVRVSYWQVPEEVLEDDEDLRYWFSKSLAEARKAAAPKRKIAIPKTSVKKKSSIYRKAAPKKKTAARKTSKKSVRSAGPTAKKKVASKRKAPARKKRKS